MTPREIAVLDLARLTRTLDEARTEWETAIVAARHAGVPVRNIADVAGVSPQTVLNIYGRVTASGG